MTKSMTWWTAFIIRSNVSEVHEKQFFTEDSSASFSDVP